MIRWSIEAVAPLVRKKQLSPVELVELLLRRIETENPRLNAYLTVCAEEAIAAARQAQREILRGRYRSPLHGVPIAVKDNIWTQGVRTTAGSKVLGNFIPDSDATVVIRLRRAGAILLGKTNLHEFAYGVTTENPHYGPTRNPWDTTRMAGGSSGGSAAAVASGLCCGALGSDTGGSIRIPAAFCGVVGLKPTYGRVSCYGIAPLAPSLDHAGLIAHTVGDAAVLLRATAGCDPRDQATARRPVPNYAAKVTGAGRLRFRLGWPKEFFLERVDAEVKTALQAAAHTFEKLGARVEELALPSLADAADTGTTISLAEATHCHQRAGWFPAHAADYSEEVRKRLAMGSEVRALDYLAARQRQEAIRAGLVAALARMDAIVAPTCPVTAPRLGEKMLRIGDEDESVRSALLRLNRPANLAGLPAVSLPCGFSREGLPIGLQLIGAPWEEARLLRIARIYEQATDGHRKHPPET